MNKITYLIAGAIIVAAAGWFAWQQWFAQPTTLPVIETITPEQANQALEETSSDSEAADKTIDQVDAEFSQLDEADFNTDDLSDQALEL